MGLYYVLIMAGIVFVVWGFAHEKELIEFEDKLWAAIKDY